MKELDTISFEAGDVIITTFTSSPPIMNAVLSDANYTPTIQVVSGYNFWGESSNVTSAVRRIYLSGSDNLSVTLCDALGEQVSYLKSLPYANDFLALSESDKSIAISTLENNLRIIVVDPVFDLDKRKFTDSSERSDWWWYRSVPNINREIFDSPQLSKIYENPNVVLYKANLSCSLS
jgi:hypothetical protein